jgi:hypothetical protein
MDDFLVFGNDKEDLLELKIKIRDFLKNRLELDLHEGKSQVYKTRNGIKFLGFRIYDDHRRLASDNVKRFKKRLKRFAYDAENGRIAAEKINDSVRCWAAHSRYADTGGLRRKIYTGLAQGRLGSLLENALLN